MVLALFLAEYLFLGLFAASIPDEAELAAFFAAYLAVSNVVELGIELWFTPWLIRRVGVRGANLLHPVLMLGAFVGLAARFDFASAIGARAARELAENGIAMPVRSLVYNAMPARFRGRMRALLEGIVFYAGMSLAGGVLILFRDADPLWLCGAGAAAALAYFLANVRTRRAYVDTLVEQLRAGRLDLTAMGRLGAWEASRLAELWELLLRTEGERPFPELLELAPHLAARGIVEPLVRAASHPNAAVRRACIEALAGTGAAAGPLALALDDADAGVRLTALRGLARPGADRGFLAARARELLSDPDPRVRAEAALECGAEGLAVLEKMAGSGLAAEAVAALAVAPAALAPAVVRCARSAHAEIRAAALESLARQARGAGPADGAGPTSAAPPGEELAPAELADALADPHPAVRRASLRLLATRRDPGAAEQLARSLDDASAEVRAAAETALAARGAGGVAAAEPYLRSRRCGPWRRATCATPAPCWSSSCDGSRASSGTSPSPRRGSRTTRAPRRTCCARPSRTRARASADSPSRSSRSSSSARWCARSSAASQTAGRACARTRSRCSRISATATRPTSSWPSTNRGRWPSAPAPWTASSPSPRTPRRSSSRRAARRCASCGPRPAPWPRRRGTRPRRRRRWNACWPSNACSCWRS
jgi:hypothetical protein